jgi:hypothetical protein
VAEKTRARHEQEVVRPRAETLARVLGPGLAAATRLAEALGVPAERFAEGVEDPAGDEGRQ